jgi:multiple sugar transport system permease protein
LSAQAQGSLAGAEVLAGPVSGRAKRGLGWAERYAHYWLLLPAAVAMGGILIYPMLYSLWVSFFNWPLTSQGTEWVGFGNYVDAVTSPFFRRVLVQSVGFMLVCLALNFVFGMGLALLLNLEFPGRRIFRTLFLLPMLIAPALTGFNFRWIFNDRFGLANQLILLFHLGEPRAWLTDPTLARVAVVATTVWSGTPFFMLILLAGLQSLPSTPFEAATVDGANAWRRFRDITLPLLRPVIAVAAAIQVIDLFRVFDTIYIMTSGGPAHATELFPYYTWRSAFSEDRAGFASALGYITLLITTLFLIPVVRADRGGEDA